MGRIRKKSTKEILEACCQVFWKKGYAQTSVKDLEKATGLRPASLYHSFESKERLFKEVLEYYSKTVVEGRIQDFLCKETGNPLKNIKKVFDSVIKLPCEHRWIGCLMTNSSVDAHNIPAVKKMAEEVFDAFEKGFLKQLNRVPGLKREPLKHRKKLARHVLLSMQGFFVLVRMGNDDKTLKKHVNDLFYFLKFN